MPTQRFYTYYNGQITIKPTQGKESNVMAIAKMIDSIILYISDSFRTTVMDVMRVFQPSDDEYPVIGVQPFTGEPYKPGRAGSW